MSSGLVSAPDLVLVGGSAIFGSPWHKTNLSLANQTSLLDTSQPTKVLSIFYHDRLQARDVDYSCYRSVVAIGLGT